jgi:hypothetical protein
VRRVGGVDELAVHDEQQVEPRRRFGGFGLRDVPVGVDARVLRDAGVFPEAVLAGAADEAQAELDLTGHRGLSFSRR